MIKYDIKKLGHEDKIVFKDMLPYLSQNLNEYNLKNDILEVFCNDEDSAEIIRKLDDLQKMLNKLDNCEKLKTKIIEDYTYNNPQNHENVFKELIDNGDITEITEGSFSYSGLFLNVLDYFDKKIDAFANIQFENVKKVVYPNLHPINDYIKGRYFESFPHYIMFQTELKNDLEIYNRCSKNTGEIKEILKEIKEPQNVLRHAACVPLYSSLENQIIDKNEVKSFIVSGKCFRNEESNLCELSRLNEFFMKEYVFIGNDEFINKFIDKSKELVRFWVEKFKLNSKYETANDSFFANNYKKLKLFQIIGNSKLEFKVLVPHQKNYISASSVNYHRSHFCKPYKIKNSDGEYCYSACFAFGLERLAYSFLSQKGLSYEKWDKETIDEIKRYVQIGV